MTLIDGRDEVLNTIEVVNIFLYQIYIYTVKLSENSFSTLVVLLNQPVAPPWLN